MNLDCAKNKIQNYLNSNKTWPLLVDFQTKQDLAEVTEYFKIGENHFPSIEHYCDHDGLLKVDELFDLVKNNDRNLFISNITGFLKLMGESQTTNVLRTLITTSIKGHIIIFTYQCKNYMKFSDPRIYESGRLIIVDGIPDSIPEICLISPELSDAFPGSYRGIEKIGYILETCLANHAYIVTDVSIKNFGETIFRLTQLNNGYEILCDRDPKTSSVPQSIGSDSNWNYVLQYMGSKGNWDSVIFEHFGAVTNLSSAMASYYSFDANRRWLYFVALSMFGAGDNEYLQLAVDRTSSYDGLVRAVYRSIISVEHTSESFKKLYQQRKSIIQGFKTEQTEVVEFCKVLSVKEENAIYYLTDLTQPEKERIITWLSVYGDKYSSKQLVEILRGIYPDLAYYLSDYHYKNELLNKYFSLYKYQKVINRILPSFIEEVNNQAKSLDFVSVLKSRSLLLDTIDVSEARAFFFDALGVEYLSYFRDKCSEYGLSLSVSCARCELPSLTSFNKDFVDTLRNKGCIVTDIKELDEIKHHGEDNFDYEKVKTPVYLIRELEIIDELIKKIRVSILNEQYKKAIIVSDHGASRLAVLYEKENIWSMETKGEHSGRCCKVSEIDSKPDDAIEQSDYWVLANYDRFRGSRKANVEVHGGATIEEVTIPIIEITQKQSNIEAFIIDSFRTISLGAKEHAIIKVYVGIKSNSISIKINDSYYDAVMTNEQYIYCIELPEYTKKGIYSFDILNGDETLAVGQQFEIKKKGMAENNLFG